MVERKELHRRIAKLAGINPQDFDFDRGLQAIEKVRGYVRSVICALINLTLHDGIELGKNYFAVLDRRFREEIK